MRYYWVPFDIIYIYYIYCVYIYILYIYCIYIYIESTNRGVEHCSSRPWWKGACSQTQTDQIILKCKDHLQQKYIYIQIYLWYIYNHKMKLTLSNWWMMMNWNSLQDTWGISLRIILPSDSPPGIHSERFPLCAWSDFATWRWTRTGVEGKARWSQALSEEPQLMAWKLLGIQKMITI